MFTKTEGSIVTYLCNEYNLLSSREIALSYITEVYGLDYIYYILCLKNPSSYLPYHNNAHAVEVAVQCAEALNYEGSSLPMPTKIGLLIGALMHDFGHSGGKCEDRFNIECAYNAIKLHAKSYSSEMVDVALRCVMATQYPYVVEAVSLEEKIIRDADLMTVYHPDMYIAVKRLLGLKEESFKDMPLDEFKSKSLEFYNNISWNTEWAKEKADEFRFYNRVTAIIEAM